MNEYDSRQLRLMRRKIDQFQADETNIGILIDDLRALLDVLEFVPYNWKTRFYEEWWHLEEIFAVALDRDYVSVMEESKKDISESVNKMKELISNQLNGKNG